VYVSMCIYTCTYNSHYIYIYIMLCDYTYIHICIMVCVCVCVYVYIYLCICVITYILQEQHQQTADKLQEAAETRNTRQQRAISRRSDAQLNLTLAADAREQRTNSRRLGVLLRQYLAGPAAAASRDSCDRLITLGMSARTLAHTAHTPNMAHTPKQAWQAVEKLYQHLPLQALSIVTKVLSMVTFRRTTFRRTTFRRKPLTFQNFRLLLQTAGCCARALQLCFQ